MRHSILSRIKDYTAKILGLPSVANTLREEKFNRLTGDAWHSPPDRFCPEEKRIHPKLIGRFYGENNLKKSALEIRRLDDGRLVFRCAYKTRTRSTWSDNTLGRETNRYFCLVAKGSTIGAKNGLIFRRGPDRRYYLGYKANIEIIMKKV